LINILWNFVVIAVVVCSSRLVNEWAQLDQSIIDAAISQWRRRLSACVRARGAHFEHKF